MTTPILCAPALAAVDQKLLALLAELSDRDWESPTAVPGWAVRDVAAHLLDTALRRLSTARDRCFVEQVCISGPADLGALIQRWNAEGVRVYRRLSPALLRTLLAVATQELAAYFAALDPMGEAPFPVTWAGEERSLNWFDTARELTERWHHQQQIREAVGKPGIMTPELYHPVLDCFARALPFTLRHHAAPPGTLVELHIRGDCGGSWTCRRAAGAWVLLPSPPGPPQTRVVLDQEWAWKLFSNGMTKQEAASRGLVEGNADLAAAVLSLTAIVTESSRERC